MGVIALKGWEHETNTTGTITTTATYASTTWVCPELSHKTIIIQNEGASNSLTYRINVRSYPDGEQYTFKEDTVAASDQDMIALNNYYYEVEISVKDGSGSTTCTIDYGGRI